MIDMKRLKGTAFSLVISLYRFASFAAGAGSIQKMEDAQSFLSTLSRSILISPPKTRKSQKDIKQDKGI